MNQEGWFQWAAVRAGDQVWMGGREGHGGQWWPVTEDPIVPPPGWADVPSVWVVVAGHGLLQGSAERVWCRPASYRPQDDTEAAMRRAAGLVREQLGGVGISWMNERRG